MGVGMGGGEGLFNGSHFLTKEAVLPLGGFIGIQQAYPSD